MIKLLKSNVKEKKNLEKINSLQKGGRTIQMTIDVPSDIRESRRQKHATRIVGPKFYIQWKYPSEIKMNKDTLRGFPGGPVVKIPRFQNRRHGFDPWLGNQDSACCKAGGGGAGRDILRWRKTKRIYWKRFTLNEWLGKNFFCLTGNDIRGKPGTSGIRRTKMVNITDYFSPKFFKIHMAFESKNYNIVWWDFQCM